jgi:hypothetical protein
MTIKTPAIPQPKPSVKPVGITSSGLFSEIRGKIHLGKAASGSKRKLNNIPTMFGIPTTNNA